MNDVTAASHASDSEDGPRLPTPYARHLIETDGTCTVTAYLGQRTGPCPWRNGGSTATSPPTAADRFSVPHIVEAIVGISGIVYGGRLSDSNRRARQ